MPVVELAGVTKAYESKVAVSNLSLSIEAGHMFGLLGPNGAGKTSSIRMMMGITVPDSGRVSLFDKPFARQSLNRVGYKSAPATGPSGWRSPTRSTKRPKNSPKACSKRFRSSRRCCTIPT